MFMVVTLHIPLEINAPFLSMNYNVRMIFIAFSYSAVNTYGLLSGYCMYGKKTKIKRFLGLWLQLLFYSVLNFIISYFMDKSFSVNDLIKSLLPLSSGFLWYGTAYLIMYLFIPYLNKLLENIDFIQTRKLIFSLLIVFGLGSWFASHVGGGKIIGVDGGYTVIWLMIMFLIGASIKKYGVSVIFKRKIKNIWYLIISVLSSLLLFSSEFVFYAVTNIIFKNPKPYSIFYEYCSPLVLLSSICLLIFFSQLNIKNNRIVKIISFLSTFTFGTYIIHSTSAFSNLIWNNILKIFDNYFVINFIISIFVTVLICIIIDYIRISIFKIFKVDIILDRILCKIQNILSNFFKTNET